MDFATEPKNISKGTPDSKKSSQTRNHRFAKSFKVQTAHLGHFLPQLGGFSGTIRVPAVSGPILLQFSGKSPHRLSKVSHFFDLSCAGKL